MFVTYVDRHDIFQRNVHSQPPIVGQLQWHQCRGHFQLVEVRIREGHPVEVLLLLVDLVYQQAEVSHPKDLQDDL